MTKRQSDSIVIAIATAVWALFLYTGLLPVLFWWVAPLIMFGAVSTLLVCSLLEASPLIRPALSLLPPALSVPPLAMAAWHDKEFGLLPVAMLIYPAVLSAALYFCIALVHRIRSNNSFKPNMLRSSKRS